MYSFQNINLHFGDLHLLDKISFVISKGDKAALVGKNGAGKSTLFKILTGELSADSGDLSIPNNTKIGYLSQHFDLDESKSIQQTCLDCFKDYFDNKAESEKLHTQLESLTDEKEIGKVLDRIAELELIISSLAQTNPLAETSRILKGFGFKEEQFNHAVSTLSGGWKMRVQMSKLLLQKPDLLLLDEPDNHLDIEALIWFEKYLQNYSGAIIFITHDVEFLSNVANKVLELANRSIFEFKGSYKKYIASKALRREKEEQAYVNQQKVIKEKERTITRFMAKATKTKMAQSMKKQLDKLERVELSADDITQIKIDFPVTGKPGKTVLKLKGICKSYGDKEVLDSVDLQIDRGDKVAFVGQNGQGKSTLVKIIADKIKANSGDTELGANVIINYFAQDQSDTLNTKNTILEELEDACDPDYRTKCRSILGAFAFSGEEVDKKISVLSGGEKSRLSMACLVSQKSNFLILDEPTNHLDIHAKDILKQAILNYPGTLIIVSHDREILRGSIDITYEFRDKNIIKHLGDLDYVLSKRKTDDVRNFTLANEAPKASKAEKKKSILSYEERKKINRNISKAERKISSLEDEIKAIHAQLVDPQFYNSPEAQSSIKKLKELEEELETQNNEWDKWVSQLDD